MAFEKIQGFKFPSNAEAMQLRTAIQAVFESWDNPRAVEYRKLEGISEDMGTAVNVQAMVHSAVIPFTASTSSTMK